MKRISGWALCLTTLAACASHGELRADECVAAEKVELQIDSDGKLLEVEYHVLPAAEAAPPRPASMVRLGNPAGCDVGPERGMDVSSMRGTAILAV